MTQKAIHRRFRVRTNQAGCFGASSLHAVSHLCVQLPILMEPEVSGVETPVQALSDSGQQQRLRIQ